ncbi:MAG: ABC transporter ATP-binding protein [Spirochaetes bacterium]|nr:ABC transporter ATP-binding protein [Spirochaetota bacterium]
MNTEKQDIIKSDYFKVSDLSCHQGNFIIDNISFTLPKGKILTILGISGSGKTLLLKAISGLLTPDSGNILLDDKQFDSLKIKDKKIGFVFQENVLYPHFIIKKNISFPLELEKDTKNEVDEKVKKVFELYNLPEFYKNFKPNQLSEGIKKVVSLAKEKTKNINLLLLDEPFSGLDKENKEILRKLFKKIIDKIGVTTIIAMSSLKDAFPISDYILILNNGKMIQFGETNQVYNNPNSLDALESMNYYGINKIKVVITNNKIFNLNITTDHKDGNFDMYFRAENIKISDFGFKTKIKYRTFLNSSIDLCECLTFYENNEYNTILLLPKDTNDEFYFIPEKFFIFK